MSLPFVVMGKSPYARLRLDPAVSCDDVMKDKDRVEHCDMLSLECEPEPWLDGPEESAHFTPLSIVLILHNTCNNNTQTKEPSTLGVSVSIRRTGVRKQEVV
jgi:hypothetical protein